MRTFKKKSRETTKKNENDIKKLRVREMVLDLEDNQGRNNIYIIGVPRNKNKQWNRTNIHNLKKTISGCKDLNLPI